MRVSQGVLDQIRRPPAQVPPRASEEHERPDLGLTDTAAPSDLPPVASVEAQGSARRSPLIPDLLECFTVDQLIALVRAIESIGPLIDDVARARDDSVAQCSQHPATGAADSSAALSDCEGGSVK